MPTFVVNTEHLPQLCQTTNAKCADPCLMLGEKFAGLTAIPMADVPPRPSGGGR